MCGIIGYVGKKNAVPILIEGLKSLEYRGYDSAGIAIKKQTKTKTIKTKGKVSELEKKIDQKEESHIGIAHTRWATHGMANQVNAHPHSCEKITLVHNGIIENYRELKEELEKKGYHFQSETDSEVIAVLLNDLLKEKGILKAIVELKTLLKGSYALAILCSEIGDKIFAIRKDSPLILETCETGSFVASDISAILKYSNHYFLLEEEEVAVLEKDKITFYNDKLEPITKSKILFEGDFSSTQKKGFEHFMLKEIWEQKEVLSKLIEKYCSLTEITERFHFLKDYERIDIVACGSAYHAGLIAKNIIEELAGIPVYVEVASEYRYKEHFLNTKTLVILVSQSGETADTLAALRKVKEEKIETLGIVNVVESSIARESDHVIYIEAGPEIAVATTKAFTAQVYIMTLIAIYLGYQKQRLSKDKIEQIESELKNLPAKIEEILKGNYELLGKELSKKEHLFFIGRKIDYAIAQEGSLKLKEISYIHSEAYPAGELKHGTISLIEKNTPVIAIITDPKLKEKTISNIEEVMARGADTIIISDQEIKEGNHLILLPQTHPILMPILAIIPLQLLSYYTAKEKGVDIDKPRNLAKSVTVE